MGDRVSYVPEVVTGVTAIVCEISVVAFRSLPRFPQSSSSLLCFTRRKSVSERGRKGSSYFTETILYVL